MKDLHRWLVMETEIGTETGIIEAVEIVIGQVTATGVTTEVVTGVITEVEVTEVLMKASCGAIRVMLPRHGDPKAAVRMKVAGARLLTLQLCFVKSQNMIYIGTRHISVGLD